MNAMTVIMDVLIYVGAGVVLLVGGYVLLRFFKGEIRKRKNK